MRQMQSRFHRSSHELPGLNLASMPDLIFTVLFFFMIVTHMRHDEVKVRYEVPAGSEVRKLEQKASVVNLYIGEGGIQVNGELTTLSQLGARLQAERRKMSPGDAERLTVSLKADKKTPMGTIADVKRVLQESYALRINYTGAEQAANP